MLDSGALRAEDDPAQKKEMFHIAITHGSVFATTSEPQHAHPDTISPKALPHRSLQTSLSKPHSGLKAARPRWNAPTKTRRRHARPLTVPSRRPTPGVRTRAEGAGRSVGRGGQPWRYQHAQRPLQHLMWIQRQGAPR